MCSAQRVSVVAIDKKAGERPKLADIEENLLKQTRKQTQKLSQQNSETGADGTGEGSGFLSMPVPSNGRRNSSSFNSQMLLAGPKPEQFERQLESLPEASDSNPDTARGLAPYVYDRFSLAPTPFGQRPSGAPPPPPPKVFCWRPEDQ